MQPFLSSTDTFSRTLVLAYEVLVSERKVPMCAIVSQLNDCASRLRSKLDAMADAKFRLQTDINLPDTSARASRLRVLLPEWSDKEEALREVLPRYVRVNHIFSSTFFQKLVFA